MDINGCHIVSVLNADHADGFSPTVSRYMGFRQLPSPVPDTAVKVSRGPFATIKEAIHYAQSWNDASTPPPFPDPLRPSEMPVDLDADPLPPEASKSSAATDAASIDKTDPTHTANAK